MSFSKDPYKVTKEIVFVVVLKDVILSYGLHILQGIYSKVSIKVVVLVLQQACKFARMKWRRLITRIVFTEQHMRWEIEFTLYKMKRCIWNDCLVSIFEVSFIKYLTVYKTHKNKKQTKNLFVKNWKYFSSKINLKQTTSWLRHFHKNEEWSQDISKILCKTFIYIYIYIYIKMFLKVKSQVEVLAFGSYVFES